jgi:hypothetical protein
MGIESARKKMIRARKEYQRALLQDTSYRGVHYTAEHPMSEVHGQFIYRGHTYSK